MSTAEEKENLRGGIEREYSTLREAIDKQYVEDRNSRENQYHSDIDENEKARRAALLAAGLNSDGSDPQGRPTG